MAWLFHRKLMEQRMHRASLSPFTIAKLRSGVAILRSSVVIPRSFTVIQRSSIVKLRSRGIELYGTAAELRGTMIKMRSNGIKQRRYAALLYHVASGPFEVIQKIVDLSSKSFWCVHF